jgi:hypothetical protein
MEAGAQSRLKFALRCTKMQHAEMVAQILTSMPVCAASGHDCNCSGYQSHSHSAQAAVLLRPILGPSGQVQNSRRLQDAAAFRVSNGSHLGAIPL